MQTETIYNSVSPLRKPLGLCQEMMRDIWSHRRLAWILFRRDLAGQVRQSILGYAWLVAPPLMTTGVWMILNRSRIVNVPSDGLPYALFVILGTVLWQSFSAAVAKPLQQVAGAKSIVTKVKVPLEAFLGAGLIRILFDLMLALLLIFPVMLMTGWPPAITFPLVLIPIASMILLATAIGVWLIPLGAFFRDVSNALGFGLRFAMFFAPVVYALPESGTMRRVMLFNPATPLLMSARELAFTGSYAWIGPSIVIGVLSLLMLFLGMLVLRVVTPHIVARMGM